MQRVSNARFGAWLLTVFIVGMSHATPVDHEVIAVVDPSGTAHPTKILFLGFQENHHHRPESVFDHLSPAFLARSLSLSFTNNLGDLTAANLSGYDALMMYGNLISSGNSSFNQPLVPVIRDYVRGGGALVGLHVASAAFRNDSRFSDLLGGRFQRHTTGRFSPQTIRPDHLLTKNLPPLDSFDETYILKNLNPDITILQERVDGENRFPWSWVRNEELGRVFYTASGHVPAGGSTTTYDTIIQPEFLDLVLRATQWVTKRHFSTFTIGGMMASGEIVGSGSLLEPDKRCYWIANANAPEGLVIEDDTVAIDGETYTFNGNPNPEMIACPTGQGSQIFSQNIKNKSGATVQGIWKTAAAAAPILLEGRQIPGAPVGTTIASLNTGIGNGFVASRSGKLLCRINLESELPPTLLSGVFLSGEGVILEEGGSHPLLPPGVVFSNLYEGELSMNSNNQIALVANLSDAGQAIVRRNGNEIDFPIIQGKSVPGSSQVFWGEIGKIKINSAGQIIAAVSLTGGIGPGNDTVLVRVEPSGLEANIILQEGEEIDEVAFIGDLADSEFIMNERGDCFLSNTLTGASVTPDNDQVLLRLASDTRVLVRQGDPLPAISPTATMGGSLESTPLTLCSDGSICFLAQLVENSLPVRGLFRAEKSTVFKILAKGDTLEIRDGSSVKIDSFAGLLPSGDDDGYPSSSIGQSLALSITSSVGHEILVKLGGLDDLDQDGITNLVEAGIGSPPNDPSFARTFFPKFINSSGTLSYVFLLPSSPALPAPAIEQSVDLVQWTTPETIPTPWPDQEGVLAGFQRVGIDAGSEHLRQFFRLKF
jgi:type 1 glutamine amidotransferase